MRSLSAFQPRRPVYLSGSTHSLDLELSSSQYASIADASQTGLDLTTGFTFEAWIKIEQLPSTAGALFVLVSKNRESTNQRGFFIGLASSDKLQVFTSSTGTYSVGTTTETLTDAAIVTSADVGVWFHLAVSYLASTKTFGIYKNGSSVANTKSLNAATSIFNNSSAFVIGADNEGTNRWFDGLIDDVRMWDDIRTQAEIQDNMLIELQGNESNLVGYWKLNNSYLDETANNNDLTASGSPVFSGDLPFSIASNTTKAYYPLNGNPAGSLKDSLIASYKLEDVSDSFGSYTLTNNNSVAFNTGKINNCADTGSSNTNKWLNNASNLGLTTDGTGNITMAGWINMSSFISGDYDMQFALARASQRRLWFGTRNSGSQLSVFVIGSSLAHYATNYTFSTSTWYHIAVTMEGTALNLYVNGTNIGSHTIGALGTAAGFNSFSLFRESGDTKYGSGKMDEVGVWSRALTADEISRLYNAGNGQQLETRALDYSGNANHGTETAITYPQGRFGQGARFNGSTSKIAIGSTSTLQLSPTVTLSLWFKTSSTSPQIMFSKDSQATGGYIAYGLYTSFSTARDVAFRIRTATGAVFSDLVASGNYTDDKWHHIVGTYDAGTQALYVDGRRVASGGSGTVIFYATPQIPNIGISSVSDNPFNGLIDEVIIESRAWTAKEVETYYRKSNLNYRQRNFAQAFITFLVEETLTLVESVTTLRSRLFTVAENLGLVEAWTALKGISFDVADSLGLIEGYTYVHNKVFSILETLGLIESTTTRTSAWTKTEKDDESGWTKTEVDDDISSWTKTPRN